MKSATLFMIQASLLHFKETKLDIFCSQLCIYNYMSVVL